MAVFPFASSAVTSTAGVMEEPAAVLVGGTVKTSFVAGPGVMSNATLVSGLRNGVFPVVSRAVSV